MKKNKKHVLSVLLLLFVLTTIAQEKTLETLRKNITNQSTYVEIEREANKLWGTNTDQNKWSALEKKSYKKYLRWKAFWETRLDENGGFSGPAKAIAEQRKYKNTTNGEKSTSEVWTPIGPYGNDVDPSNNSPAGLKMGSQAGGIGAIHGVAYDLSDAQTMYAASSTGGLYKTIDGGDNWWNTTKDYGPAYCGFKDIIVTEDVNQNTVIYASSTGNNYGGYALDRRNYARGVFFSDDEGVTWVNLNNSGFGLELEADPDFGGAGRFIAEMKMHPSNGNLLILLYQGNDTELWEFDPLNLTWSKLNTFVDESMNELEVLPADHNIFYISGTGNFYEYDYVTNNATTLYTSGSLFAGLGIPMPADEEKVRIMLETTNDDPNNVYIYYIDRTNNTTQGDPYLITYDESTPSYGQSFNMNFSSLPTGGRYFIKIPDDDSKRIYIGAKRRFYISIDDGSGLNFVQIQTDNSPNAGSIAKLHNDYNDLDFFPNDSKKMIIGNDGGLIYRYEDVTQPTNEYIGGCGLLIAKCYSLWLDERYENSFLIGLQDGNSALLDNNGLWQTVGQGDGGMSMIDEKGNLSYKSSSFGAYNETTGGLQGLSVFIHNQQRRFHPLFPLEEVCWGSIGFEDQGLLINKETGWEFYSPSYRWWVFRAFDICESDPDVCYAASLDRNDIFRGNSGQSTDPPDWPKVSGYPALTGNHAILGQNKITRVLAHPLDPNQVWVTFGHYYAGEKIYYSPDQGVNWYNESTGLLNYPVNSIVMDKNSGYLYAGTDAGVYFKHSDDHSGAWQVYGTGLNAIAGEIRINHNFNKIVVGTLGEGVWSAPLQCPTGTTNLPNSFYGAYKDGDVNGNTQQNNNKTAVLRAMNKITLSLGFSSAPTGSNKLSAKILPCTLRGDIDPCTPGYQKEILFNGVEIDQNSNINSNISIYPNPNNGQFNIELNNGDRIANVEVYDIMGKQVFAENNINNKLSIDISNQPKGIYFVKITVGSEVFNEKIVYQ